MPPRAKHVRDTRLTAGLTFLCEQEEQEEVDEVEIEDEDDEFKAPSNPKNLPLGWDGKPIPF